jgi:hypothetical protein
MGEMIKTILINNVDLIAWYASITTLVIITLIVRNRKTKKTFVKWKKDKINILGIFTREWEVNEDEFLNDLFSENQRLEREVNLLKKQLKSASLIHALGLLLFVIGLIFGVFYSRGKK